ncbi:hypothetical protein RchiOBHm_Chr7g0196021 [Rosa chinensis]|uniref:Uncharacterized protein n=1 Tax=Rosa chinensis TaxID=74649 RepID=A0A2P6P6H3_ROSCH|nr:hypothetical protein RchiOBHm_Chr7g0196021 [Rosa chinensis]
MYLLRFSLCINSQRSRNIRTLVHMANNSSTSSHILLAEGFIQRRVICWLFVSKNS